jgi:hypothetical protein
MPPVHLALVSLTPAVDFAAVSTVNAAVQRQIVRDFGPIWGVNATIDAFARLEDVPLGYWRILVVDTFDHGGQHRDRNHQPYALVAAGSSWSLVTSHEALEMLADPFGNTVRPGDSPMAGQGRVEFLVEVCDPCESDECAYTVNGVLVSDFCTPSYYDPVRADGVRYSFTGAVKQPRQVLNGGYLTWREPATNSWFQQTQRADEAPQFKNLGHLAPGNDSLRAMIDRLTPDTHRLGQLEAHRPSMQRARHAFESARVSAAAEARDLAERLKYRP